ncbi:MAG TPA: alpha/beta fold hydrolase [Myxococcales bacterium LLY-WYZ-16_1]|nr:alpha/beta fold hydrolase [Myxococcales bacterium LLY-WYZ-16_1]
MSRRGPFHPLKRAWLARRDAFRPPPILANPHLQTVLGTTQRPVRPVEGRRLELWTTPDGDRLRVHVVDPPDDPGPTALLVHGLEGSADSPYVHGLTRRLIDRGWGVVVFDQRSCGGQLNAAPRLYHTGDTSDLDFVVRRLVERGPDRPLALVGVSMGANQILKWLGTHPVPDQVQGAAAICPPFDLTVSGPHMDRRQPWYVQYFLRRLIPKALAKERQFPGILDAARVRRARTFRTFDDAATAPLHGFSGADHYYREASCGPHLGAIDRPVLLLAAADDPFNPAETLPTALCRDHPSLIPRFVDRGGHVGFVDGRPGAFRYWMDEEVARFVGVLGEGPPGH